MRTAKNTEIDFLKIIQQSKYVLVKRGSGKQLPALQVRRSSIGQTSLDQSWTLARFELRMFAFHISSYIYVFEYQYYTLRYGEKNAVDSLHVNKQQQNWQKSCTMKPIGVHCRPSTNLHLFPRCIRGVNFDNHEGKEHVLLSGSKVTLRLGSTFSAKSQSSAFCKSCNMKCTLQSAQRHCLQGARQQLQYLYADCKVRGPKTQFYSTWGTKMGANDMAVCQNQ